MFGYDLGIDLGTTNIVIGVPGKGIRLDEPAYVAYDEEKEKVLYAGKRAYFLEGREPEGLRVERPILSGVVGHYELAQQMMRHFINKVIGNSLFKPRVVVSVPAMHTDVEKRTIVSVMIHAGARSVCLVEEPLCAAFGAGIDPMQQVNSLMQAHHGLATGTPEQKQRFFSELARAYNVPLSADLVGEESPFIDPQVAALQKEIAALKSKTSAREQQEAATVRATLQKEIDSFAADPKNVYFDEVATDIAALLKSGTASTLAEAYEKAIWLNPTTRVKEQSRLTAETEAKSKAEAEAKAAAARKATAANVRSSPKSASAAAPLGSIDDTLSAALNSIRSRA